MFLWAAFLAVVPELVVAFLWSGVRVRIPVWIAAAVGYLSFPPGRHANRERYRGTRWRVWMALFLSVGLFCGHLFGAIALAVQEGRPAIDMSLSVLVVAAIATCAAAAFVMFIARLRGDAPYSLGFLKRDLGSSVWLGLQTGLLFLALDLISYKVTQTMDFWQLGGTNAVRVVFETDDAWLSVIAAFIGVVLVPFAEEVLFRGVLFAALRRTCGVTSAVVLSSMIFGLMHMPGWQMPFVLGLLLAWLYHRTGSLWAPVIAHMMVNVAALGLGFNRGVVMRYLSWTEVGVLVVLVGLAQLVRSRRQELASCVCGFTAPGVAERCPECAYPLRVLDPAVTLAARLMLFAGLSAVGGGCAVFDQLAGRPYTPGRSAEVVGLQYGLLRSTGREALASGLLKAWRSDQPDAPGPLLMLAQEAYLREDYAEIVRLAEPVSKRSDAKDVHYARMAKNMVALALAEIGGARGEEAVLLAREALEEAPEDSKKNIEDTLGWALVRVGHLEEARGYLDRELLIYGLATRAGVAELAYHRGVLLWSIGDEGRAREVLALAADLDPPVEPYTRRAKQIRERGCLPEGLVPVLPPPLPESPRK